MTPLERVRAELARYQHLLLVFEAEHDPSGGVELVIHLKTEVPGAHTYRAPIHPRDIEQAQFPWTFQKYLYDCLHDYLCEMFISNPQEREPRS
ncbi:hypothetical protein [Paludibaculum fermentans]|uniref:hypothetical protein n=1 Tax=Paludibaculum fermentans TaxID=1473598 RepID=UPI003EB85681